MIEADVETQVVKWAKAQGGLAVKLKDEAEIGFPDRTLFLPGRQIIIPELKRPKGGRKSHMQKVWRDRLQALGFPVEFCKSLDEVVDLYERSYP
jgi:hypothetical protein